MGGCSNNYGLLSISMMGPASTVEVEFGLQVVPGAQTIDPMGY